MIGPAGKPSATHIALDMEQAATCAATAAPFTAELVPMLNANDSGRLRRGLSDTVGRIDAIECIGAHVVENIANQPNAFAK